MTQKLFAIGDIHGCHEQMLLALDWIEKRSTDTGAEVIFLGDYVDRGQKSKEVIETIRKGPRRASDTWIAIKGNHESMMQTALVVSTMQTLNHWYINGGKQTEESFGDEGVPDDVLEWVKNLPIYHQTENYIFVHAGARPEPIEEQRAEELMWMRRWEWNEFDQPEIYKKHVVYGHTPAKGPFLMVPYCTGLDTGACYGEGYGLTVAEFNRNTSGHPIALHTFPSEGEGYRG